MSNILINGQGKAYTMKPILFYRPADILEIFSISRATLYRWIDAGILPKADVRITSKCVGWRRETIHSFLIAYGIEHE